MWKAESEQALTVSSKKNEIRIIKDTQLFFLFAMIECFHLKQTSEMLQQ